MSRLLNLVETMQNQKDLITKDNTSISRIVDQQKGLFKDFYAYLLNDCESIDIKKAMLLAMKKVIDKELNDETEKG